jgi:hypothetical protein
MYKPRFIYGKHIIILDTLHTANNTMQTIEERIPLLALLLKDRI